MTHPRPMDDRELIKRALEGDQSAYAELFHAHRGKLFAMLFKRARNWPDAEELVQLTFISAFQHLDEFHHKCEFFTWLYNIAMNCLRLVYRDEHCLCRSVNNTVSLADTEFAVGADDPALTMVPTRIDLSRGIAQLPPGYRKVLMLHAEGYSHTQIGKLLGCSWGTSASQLSKGRQFLRELMAQ